MAVKQTVSEPESVSKPGENNICDISTLLNLILYLQDSNNQIVITCDLLKSLVGLIGVIPVPRDAVQLKNFKESLNKVKNFFNEFCMTKNDTNEVSINVCLQTLYQLISKSDQFSGAASIILDIVSDERIPSAVAWILKNEEQSDQDLKCATIVLCNWLCVTNFSRNLNIWIVAMLNGLREQHKFKLLVEISNKVILQMFKTIRIPLFREKVIPVIQLILTSNRHTPDVFNQIIPLATSVLILLENDLNVMYHQNFVDIISALIEECPVCDGSYNDIKIQLKKYSTSPNYRRILDVPQWNEVTYQGYLPIINKNARVGLVNLGNTCYMNSVLQSLVMTKKFSREILLSAKNTPLLQKVQGLLALMLYSLRPELTPRDFLHAARPPGFLPGQQQDSSEFLGYLLETLHEQEKFIMTTKHHTNNRPVHNNQPRIHDGKLDDGQRTDGNDNFNCLPVNVIMDVDEVDDDQNGAAAPVISHSPHEVTLVQKSFGGRVSITYKCLNCGSSSQNVDSFRDLQLSFTEFQNNSNYSVQYLLDCYCAPEKLDGDNKYACDKCKSLSDGERYINILSAPKNLILTLKYFKYDQKHHTRAKLLHKTDLDDVVFLKTENHLVRYRLYAAVVHSGTSMDSGHYYTYAADKPDTWYQFNDSYVTKTTLDDLQSLKPPNTPYILFYHMQSSQENGDDGSVTESESPHISGVVDGSDSGGNVNSVCVNDGHMSNEHVLPKLENLSVRLQELVRNDNLRYNEEIAGRRQTKGRPYLGLNNF